MNKADPTGDGPAGDGPAGSAVRTAGRPPLTLDTVRNAAAILALAAAGTLLLQQAYRIAGAGGDGHLLSWAGLALLLGPAAAAAIAAARPAVRTAAIVHLAVLSSIPKLLLTGLRPGYSDEYAHLREVIGLLGGWPEGQGNTLVRMASEYPGMHTVAAAAAEIAGLDATTALALIVTAAHTMLLVGVGRLIAETTGDSRAGAAAAVVYATNPSFLLFDMQMAYESFALPIAVWALIAAGRGARAAADARLPWQPSGKKAAVWSATAATAGAAVAVSHHLTSILLAGTAAIIAAVGTDQERRVYGRLAITTAAVAATWAVTAADGLAGYLAPSIPRTSNLRTAFSGTRLPWYELGAGYAYPVLITICVLLAAHAAHPHVRRLTGAEKTLILLGGLFVASIPVVLIPESAEGARRTWAWTMIGGAYAAGAVIRHLTGRTAARTAGRRAARTAAAVMLAVLAVGGVALGQNVTYRFPGPSETGNDTRSYTAAAEAAGETYRLLARPGDRVVADRYVRGSIAVSAPVELLSPSEAWPAWAVLYAEDPAAGYAALHAADVRWYTVDMRMFDRTPARGFWYNTEELKIGVELPVPAERLDRLTCLGEAAAVTGPYITVRIDAGLLGKAAKEGGCP